MLNFLSEVTFVVSFRSWTLTDAHVLTLYKRYCRFVVHYGYTKASTSIMNPECMGRRIPIAQGSPVPTGAEKFVDIN